MRDQAWKCASMNPGTTHFPDPSTSTASVELTNDIEIDNWNACQVYVWDNPDTDADVAILSGDIIASGNQRLRKFGDGTLVLTGTNDFGATGELEIQNNGAVRAEDGVSLPTTAKLNFNGAGSLETNGTFEREIGNEAGKVYWSNAGGFAAYGGALTVTLTPAGGSAGGQLTWGSATLGFNGKNLVLGSTTANDVVTLTNAIDAGNSNRDMYLWDNASSDNDRSVLAGDVTNMRRFRLYKGGTLVIAEGATMSLDGGDVGADVEVNDGSTLIVNGTLNLADDLFMNGTAPTLGGKGTINTYSIAGNTSIINVNSGRYLAPGDGVGTLTIETGAGDEFQMDGGSTYLWEVGQSGSTDILAITGDGRLDINDMTLKILDGGGYVASATVELPVFTYDIGTTIVEALGTITFDTDELDGTWTIDSPALIDGGEGIIYLTGLSGGTPDTLLGDANGDGVVDAADYIMIKRNFGGAPAVGEGPGGDLNGDEIVDWYDLQILQAAYDAGAGANTIPEPTTLLIMMAAGLPALLKRRRS